MSDQLKFIIQKIKENYKYLIIGVILFILFSTLKNYISVKIAYNNLPTITDSKKSLNDLSSDANYIICLYDQKDCLYNNTEKTIMQVIDICGKRNKCDTQ